MITEEDKVVIHDIAAEKMPSHDDLLKSLPIPPAAHFIEYRFFPDKLNLRNTGRRFIEDSPLMVGTSFPKMDDIILPFTINA
ncbi:MAG: hypothetical protein ACLFR1_01495 [Spirochaetia bacterium]